MAGPRAAGTGQRPTCSLRLYRGVKAMRNSLETCSEEGLSFLKKKGSRFDDLLCGKWCELNMLQLFADFFIFFSYF